MDSSLILLAYFIILIVTPTIADIIYKDKKYGLIKVQNSIFEVICLDSNNGLNYVINTASIKVNNSISYELTLDECSFNTSILDITKKLNITIHALILNFNEREMTRKQFQGLTIKSLEFFGCTSKIDFHEDLLYDLPLLEKFNMQYSNITRITDQFFKQSENLKELNIKFNAKLSKIKQKNFLGLTKLEVLNLIYNKELIEIESKVFDELISLRKLFIIKHPKLETLPAEMLKNLKNLECLELAVNRINSLPDNLLNDITDQKLKKFDFSKNYGDLPSLAGGFFKNSKQLEEIHLSFNRFKSVPEDLFLGAESLISLDLSHNNLMNLPSKLFKNTVKLNTLCLAGNKLNMIYENLFETTNLTSLDLSNNQLIKLLMLVFYIIKKKIVLSNF